MYSAVTPLCKRDTYRVRQIQQPLPLHVQMHKVRQSHVGLNLSLAACILRPCINDPYTVMTMHIATPNAPAGWSP